MHYKVFRDAGRGRSDFGWLDSRHSFSFGGFHDSERMGFGPLRVINDDRVAGGGGSSPRWHRMNRPAFDAACGRGGGEGDRHASSS